MNQLDKQRAGRAAFLAIILAGLPLTGVKAQTVTLDNFNEYTSASYIQGSNTLASAQQGTNVRFLRFGSAVSDVVYSSAAAGTGGARATAARWRTALSPRGWPPATRPVATRKLYY